jgi:hypothetical protein
VGEPEQLGAGDKQEERSRALSRPPTCPTNNALFLCPYIYTRLTQVGRARRQGFREGPKLQARRRTAPYFYPCSYPSVNAPCAGRAPASWAGRRTDSVSVSVYHSALYFLFRVLAIYTCTQHTNMYTHTQHTFIAMYGARLEWQGAPSPLRARRRTDILMEATRRGAASSRTHQYVLKRGMIVGWTCLLLFVLG